MLPASLGCCLPLCGPSLTPKAMRLVLSRHFGGAQRGRAICLGSHSTEMTLLSPAASTEDPLLTNLVLHHHQPGPERSSCQVATPRGTYRAASCAPLLSAEPQALLGSQALSLVALFPVARPCDTSHNSANGRAPAQPQVCYRWYLIYPTTLHTGLFQLGRRQAKKTPPPGIHTLMRSPSL